MKLNELNESSIGRMVFWVKKKDVNRTSKGANYFALVVADNTLELQAKVWDSDNELVQFTVGDFILADYRCNLYNGQLQLIISNVSHAADGTYLASDFFKTTKYNVDWMYTKLIEYVDNVSTECYRKALQLFFNDEEFSKAFRQHPAAVSVHHSFIGGLLQHTFFVTRNAFNLSKSYAVDSDLCVTAAIMHDLGKIKEISGFPAVEMTRCGVALGHVVMSAQSAYDAVIKCGGTEDQALKLMHCILAHHGTKEWGSPVVPACKEAMILHVADLLDARIECMDEVYAAEADREKETTQFGRYLGTQLLF